MPRTETCSSCSGSGDNIDIIDGTIPCSDCGGNGYVMPPITFENMTAEEAGIIADNAESIMNGAPKVDIYAATAEAIRQQVTDLDLTDDTPAPGRMANQTWRILEEQKQAAEETIREAEAEIARWTKKRDDAARTKRGCEAGQRALDGDL